MSSCLVALGANLGDRRATLEAALTALATEPATKLLRQSSWHATRPVGMSDGRNEFLNGAALLQTALELEELHALLQQIEGAHGRRPGQRWTDRTLDLDLLLFDQLIIDTPALVVPHPRMSYRRFVLEPAAEIAADWIHPVLGWTVGQLSAHLAAPGNMVAVVSPGEKARLALVAAVCSHWSVELVEPSTAAEVSQLWPREVTSWLCVSNNGTKAEAGAATAQRPKLSILLDCGPTVERQPGRGPTLVIRDQGQAQIEREVLGAVEAVWPDLGR